MFRKALLAVSALTVIGAAALAPTAASAKPWHNGHHGWHGGGIYVGTPYYASYGGYYGRSCWIKRWVDTPFGPRLKRVYVCY
jgi:hypothetical protein